MREFRQTRFEILPVIVKNLIIINALIFLAQWVLGPQVEMKIFDLFALHTWQSPVFKPWQFITYMFLHAVLIIFFLTCLRCGCLALCWKTFGVQNGSLPSI